MCVCVYIHELQSWHSNMRSVAPCQRSVCRKTACVCICACQLEQSVSVCTCAAEYVCVWVGSHAVLCAQHLTPLPLSLHTEGLSSTPLGAQSDQACERRLRGGWESWRCDVGWCAGGWKIPPDFKFVKRKSRPLYVYKEGLCTSSAVKFCRAQLPTRENELNIHMELCTPGTNWFKAGTHLSQNIRYSSSKNPPAFSIWKNIQVIAVMEYSVVYRLVLLRLCIFLSPVDSPTHIPAKYTAQWCILKCSHFPKHQHYLEIKIPQIELTYCLSQREHILSAR